MRKKKCHRKKRRFFFTMDVLLESERNPLSPLLEKSPTAQYCADHQMAICVQQDLILCATEEAEIRYKDRQKETERLLAEYKSEYDSNWPSLNCS